VKRVDGWCYEEHGSERGGCGSEEPGSHRLLILGQWQEEEEVGVVVLGWVWGLHAVIGLLQ